MTPTSSPASIQRRYWFLPINFSISPYVPITDDEAVEAFEYLARTEGIICAIESAHAVAYAMKIAKNFSSDENIIINLSGRGDKDVAAIARYKGEEIYE